MFFLMGEEYDGHAEMESGLHDFLLENEGRDRV